METVWHFIWTKNLSITPRVHISNLLYNTFSAASSNIGRSWYAWPTAWGSREDHAWPGLAWIHHATAMHIWRWSTRHCTHPIVIFTGHAPGLGFRIQTGVAGPYTYIVWTSNGLLSNLKIEMCHLLLITASYTLHYLEYGWGSGGRKNIQRSQKQKPHVAFRDRHHMRVIKPMENGTFFTSWSDSPRNRFYGALL